MEPRHTIGCALWSLGEPDTVRGIGRVAEMEFEAVQFAFLDDADLEPERLRDVAAALERSGLTSVAGMISFPGEDYTTLDSIRATGGFIPPKPFEARLDRCRRVGRALASLGLEHVTTHAGTVPEPNDATYGPGLERVARAVDALHAEGLTVGLETGPETSAVLSRLLDDLGRDFVSVNFDPANFVLYGTENPVEAARALAPRVTLMHAKDAAWAEEPGRTWGAETVPGEGLADVEGVLAALESGGFGGPIVLEREGGTDRPGDLKAGKAFIEAILERRG